MDEMAEAADAESKQPRGFEGLAVGGNGVSQEALYLDFPYIKPQTNNYTI